MRDIRITSGKRIGEAFLITVLGTLPLGLSVCAFAEGVGIAQIRVDEDRFYSIAIPICMAIAWCWLFCRDQREYLATPPYEKSLSDEKIRTIRRDRAIQAWKETRIASGRRIFSSIAFTYMGPWPISIMVLDRVRAGQSPSRTGIDWMLITVHSASAAAIWCTLLWLDHRQLRAADKAEAAAQQISTELKG